MSSECSGGMYHHFCYTTSNTIFNKYRVLHAIVCRFLNSFCTIQAFRFIRKTHRQTPYDYCFLSFDKVTQLFFFVLMLKCIGIKLVTIADEYPRPIRDKMKSSVPKAKLMVYKWLNRWVDYRILMTEYLQVFYDTKVCPKPTLILSTIVDTERFENLNVLPTSNEEYLCYMGNMALSKDNVDNIVRAFALIHDKFPSLQLHLYGAPNSKDRRKLTDLIEELNLKEKVLLKGKARYNEVPYILANAKVLVTSQPVTKRAEGGFPTKLGEYFLSGKPTILTNVGEIKKYVVNGENGFLVEPDNPQAYADTISHVLSFYNEGLEIAKTAKAYILDNFSSHKAAVEILKFLDLL